MVAGTDLEKKKTKQTNKRIERVDQETNPK